MINYFVAEIATTHEINQFVMRALSVIDDST